MAPLRYAAKFDPFLSSEGNEGIKFCHLATLQVGPVEMAGPKYPGIVESHSYGPVGVKVRGEIAVTGPVYPADPANKFCIVPERRSGQPILAGPAYHGVEAKNLYNPQTDRVSGELVMTGPVLVANGENKYHIIPGHADNVHLVSNGLKQ